MMDPLTLLTLLALLVGPVLVLILLVGLAEELGLAARPEEDEGEREAQTAEK